MFQDIMTSVTGILILIVLLQILQVGKSASQKTDDHSNQEAKVKLQEKLSELQTAESEYNSQRERQMEQDFQISAENQIGTDAELNNEISQATIDLDSINQKLKQVHEKESKIVSAVGLGADEQKLEDTEAKESSLQNEADSDSKKTDQEKSELGNLSSRVKAAQENRKQLYLIPDRTDNAKEPIVVLVSKDGIEFNRFNRPRDTVSVKATDDSAIENALDKFSADNQYFVFYVKPSAVSLFKKVSGDAHDKGFDTGSDAILEDQQIVVAQPPPDDSDLPVKPPANTVSGSGSVISHSDAQPPSLQTSNAQPPNTAPNSNNQTNSSSSTAGAKPTPPAQEQENPATNSATDTNNSVTSEATPESDKGNSASQSSADQGSGSSRLVWVILVIFVIVVLVLLILFARAK
jgi:preprotein translocase subunit SecG